MQQGRQLGLQRRIVDQQHRQYETCRAEAIGSSRIITKVETRRVQHGGQREVEQPCAKCDHEPEVEHAVRPPEADGEKGSEGETPDHRGNDGQGRRGGAAIDQHWKHGILGRGNPGQDREPNERRNGAGQDCAPRRTVEPRALVAAIERISEDEQREAAVPDHVEPRRRLWPGAEQSGRRVKIGKGQGVQQRGQRSEQISASEIQQTARSYLRHLREQQYRGDDIVDGERRLTARDERR